MRSPDSAARRHRPAEKLVKAVTVAPRLIADIAKAAHVPVPESVLNEAADFLRGRAEVACKTGCFPAGTLVATPQGSVPIDRMQVGQLVLSENPLSGTVEAEPVQAVLADPVSLLLAVDLSDGSAITVTADHPFWVELGQDRHHGVWLEAGQLWRGMRLRVTSGADVVVLGVRRHMGQAVVYTLTVAKDHTYFVGSAQVLVIIVSPES
jgi:hypothetical protein